jgi:hypothetical protein
LGITGVHSGLWWESHEENGHLEERDVDRRIIIK